MKLFSSLFLLLLIMYILLYYVSSFYFSYFQFLSLSYGCPILILGIILNIFLGIGKTTLIKKIVDHLKTQDVECSGFYTEEIRNNNNRIGFDIVTLNGEREILARKL